jgi:ADP-ribose pyrophosphatase YjhB (NUDIX family)
VHPFHHLFIEVFGGGFVLQKKADHTENGGKWSSAVSGHVRLNETYTEAIIREAQEELGLKLEIENLRKIAKISPCEETGNEFVTLFSYLLDPSSESVKKASDEVDAVLTCPLAAVIKDMEKDGHSYSPAFVMLFNMFLTLEGKES